MTGKRGLVYPAFAALLLTGLALFFSTRSSSDPGRSDPADLSEADIEATVETAVNAILSDMVFEPSDTVAVAVLTPTIDLDIIVKAVLEGMPQPTLTATPSPAPKSESIAKVRQGDAPTTTPTPTPTNIPLVTPTPLPTPAVTPTALPTPTVPPHSLLLQHPTFRLLRQLPFLPRILWLQSDRLRLALRLLSRHLLQDLHPSRQCSQSWRNNKRHLLLRLPLQIRHGLPLVAIGPEVAAGPHLEP